MADTKYILRYLPLFYEDLEEKVVYIAETVKNLQAANNLLDLAESAILERLPNAESFEPYRSLKERRYPYYRIYIKNCNPCYILLSTLYINEEMRKNSMIKRKNPKDVKWLGHYQYVYRPWGFTVFRERCFDTYPVFVSQTMAGPDCAGGASSA